MKITWLSSGIVSAALLGTAAGARLSERLAGIHERMLEERREALPSLSDPFGVPAPARVVMENSREEMRAGFPWKRATDTSMES